MRELAVLIPTTGRRPVMLAEVMDTIEEQLPLATVFAVTGMSWGAGLNHLIGELSPWFCYISCCCDDTVPVEGWFEAGRRMLDDGAEPASRYLRPDGTPLRAGTDDVPHGTSVPWCRSFLLTPELYAEVGPFIDATWYADIDYSERIKRAGTPIVACDGFAFTHLDGDRDWLTPEEDARQRALYEESHRRQGITGW